MAIVQRNLYLPGQDLTNLAENVDYNRYQDFKGNITVNFGVSPASVTVKVGTVIEVNGNLYAIETADYTFAMDNATHNYITFTDNPATDFGSAAAIGTYSAAKQGYYQAGNVIRTLPLYIDQTNSLYFWLMDEQYCSLNPMMKLYSRVMVRMNADQHIDSTEIIVFDTELADTLSEWNTGTYTFTATYGGWYRVTINATGLYGTANDGDAPRIIIYKNGAAYCDAIPTTKQVTDGGPDWFSGSISIIIYLKNTETISFYATNQGAHWDLLHDRTSADVWSTTACIERIL